MGPPSQSHSSTASRILVFGPQIHRFDGHFLARVGRDRHQSLLWDPLLHAVAGASTLLDALSLVQPTLVDETALRHGITLVEKLAASLGNGFRTSVDNEDLPATLLTPLTVLTSLLRYEAYLQSRVYKNEANLDHVSAAQYAHLIDKHLHSDLPADILGFCSGLLSAFAVACSHTAEQLQKNSAIAVRLAVLVGAIIDSQEAHNSWAGHGSSKSFTVSWDAPEQRHQIDSLVRDLFPDVYIAVVFDEYRVTITSTGQRVPELLQLLSAVKAKFSEVALKGQFHKPAPDRSRHVQSLISFCDKNTDLQFLPTAQLVRPILTNNVTDGRISTNAGKLHHLAIRAMLVEQCDWYGSFSAATSTLGRSYDVVSFGPELTIPPSLHRRATIRITRFNDVVDLEPSPSSNPAVDVEESSAQSHKRRTATQQTGHDTTADDDIAVVGMSIKVAGAADVEELTQLLKTGVSQHEAISPERLMSDTLFRSSDRRPSQQWYGNFISDVDCFDHRFFRRSPRESATMDPQQRLFLQAAYEAVEQSGYFHEISADGSHPGRKHVGVYVGACAGDYEHHVACHNENAFTATGNLKSFIPGKVSHHFGWTGPSMTFDTACSASAIAVHTACRDLITGDCNSALAGGVAVMSNVLWFQNLAGACFLSPTGQCKAFDDAADGYCRAEGVACVYLKRMADAVADGNVIMGSIVSSAVFQNMNCSPLFVPNAPSLSSLFDHVVHKAGVRPSDISYVEAHGTGTPVGDPVEYESILTSLGGLHRRPKPLPLGSIKGQVGHTEGASGVVSLIKVLLMMYSGFLPPQASFEKLNSRIHASPDDMIEIVTSIRPWDDEVKIALINNYGASGSNASMIVRSPPQHNKVIRSTLSDESAVSLPFWIAAFSPRSIQDYGAKLESYITSRPETTLADTCFSVNRQSNRSLPYALIASCRSIDDLKKKLHSLTEATDKADSSIISLPPERPVILCFGGQVSTFVGLDRDLYDNVTILRQHLNQCDRVVQSLGLESIFPDIFSRTPLEDPVRLQVGLFSLQYSYAKTWIECGLRTKVVALVGHSFGEITAICVSGALSLGDAVRLVVGRARLVRDAWGSHAGMMMAVEGDTQSVFDLVGEVNKQYDTNRVSIACYNSSHSFTLAGSDEAIGATFKTIETSSRFQKIRSKRLKVTNAFHSELVEPLRTLLQELGQSLSFSEPQIPVEHATATKCDDTLNSDFVFQHMRNPVYFDHAMQRLIEQHPSTIFLEAGSNSTVTLMASRALKEHSNVADSHFQAFNTINGKGLQGLSEATLSLWQQGLPVVFWMHHKAQLDDFMPLNLPPYQFEKNRHWLKLCSPLEVVRTAVMSATPAAQPTEVAGGMSLGLWTYIRKLNEDCFRFRINVQSADYKSFVTGHVIAQTAPICPATLEVSIAIDALYSLLPDVEVADIRPILRDMINHLPICSDHSREVWLDAQRLDDVGFRWGWVITSTVTGDDSGVKKHAEAEVHFKSIADKHYTAEFARFERLFKHENCTSLLNLSLAEDLEGVDVLQGRNIYSTFDEIVEYGSVYRGVSLVIAKGDECVGRVRKRYDASTWLDVPLSDCFSQVGGIWVNCMSPHDPKDMFIATGCETFMRSPHLCLQRNNPKPDLWHVYARHTRQSDSLYVTDTFVYDADNGALIEVMLGVQYQRVAKTAMSKMLTRLTTEETALASKTIIHHASALSNAVDSPSKSTRSRELTCVEDNTPYPKHAPSASSVQASSRADFSNKVRNLVAEVSGVEADRITADVEMADLGIDSLMGMELAREVETVFKCTLDLLDLMEATTLRKFVACISSALFGTDHQITANAHDVEAPPILDLVNLHEVLGSEVTHFTNDSSIASHSYESLEQEQGTSQAIALLEMPPAVSGLSLSQTAVLESFSRVKLFADHQIRIFHLENIDSTVIAASNRLCSALIVEALDELGCSLKSIAPGEIVEKIPFVSQQTRLMDFVYQFLEHQARLLNADPITGRMTRTHIALPRKKSQTILEELLKSTPQFSIANKLTYYAGTSIQTVLNGKKDGMKVLFGSVQGFELVESLYSDHPFNQMNYGQMRDIILYLAEALQHQQPDQGLKILEVGAGTGGTTRLLAPFLASLQRPIEYSYTDVSAAMVSLGRRKFGKQYPFMRFAVYDIEKHPGPELDGQHIILASNAIHATHDLMISLTHLRMALRPDGFLMMLEMTQVAPFVDLIFGLLESWWICNDGRTHSIITAEQWERVLHAAGFGHVDWIDGSLAENKFQKVIIAVASGAQMIREITKAVEVDDDVTETSGEKSKHFQTIEDTVAHYVDKWKGHAAVSRHCHENGPRNLPPKRAVVVVTGATGSLGSHLVADLLMRSDVETVVCLNRSRNRPPIERQIEAFTSRGIELPTASYTKLHVLTTDISKHQLGVSNAEYVWLKQQTTHIVHAAWPMSGSRTFHGFEPQLQTFLNLLNLASDSATRKNGPQIGFIFVSTISVVGFASDTQVPEQLSPLSLVMEGGYSEGKWACERILDQTLREHPGLFRAMSVRPGQIAGSKTSGFWNTNEHFAFLIKSSQSLRIFPAFEGRLQWTPVDDVAKIISDFMYIGDQNPPTPHCIYHIDNPVGQPWEQMRSILADELDIPTHGIIPFQAWVTSVRHSPLPAQTDNPAVQLIEFLEGNFERLSCGSVILDTKNSKDHSSTMATMGPVGDSTVRRYIASWKKMGYLHS